MAVATFRGYFDDASATLSVSADGVVALIGSVRVASLVVKDEELKAHLGSPEFFDAERFPELEFASDSVRRDGDELVLDGKLTIKGHSRVVEARGGFTAPVETFGGSIRFGLSLETVIDRTEFGLHWNAPLPRGGFALGNEVDLAVELEFELDK